MARIWRLEEAGSRFSEVVEAALNEGPQVITRSGANTAVVMSFNEYRRLNLNRKKLSTFFRESPLARVELNLTRDSGPAEPDPAL